MIPQHCTQLIKNYLGLEPTYSKMSTPRSQHEYEYEYKCIMRMSTHVEHNLNINMYGNIHMLEYDRGHNSYLASRRLSNIWFLSSCIVTDVVGDAYTGTSA